MIALSHAALVKVATKWLTGSMGCGVVITEVGGDSLFGEIPDAIGWRWNKSFVVECKVSRSDFFADRKKPFRIEGANGMGLLRFYLTPKGLLQKHEVTAYGWGLLETSGKNVQSIAPSTQFTRSLRAEHRLMYTALQRVQYRIDQPLHKVVAWDAMGTQTRVLNFEDTESKLEYL